MKKSWLFLFLITFNWGKIYSQPVPTQAAVRDKAFAQRNLLDDISLLKPVKFKSNGPTVMSGRVVDIDVNPSNYNEFYVAYASGGLWKTSNNGQSFTPLFDKQAVMTIGDIAVNWKTGRIWIGTGENNSSRSSYSGNGMYISDDGGKTWTNKGLWDSHHIGRIILHPSNNNIAWVAAIGHLYSDNSERGVFKTTDGGQTWNKTLYLDEKTGAIDLLMNPANDQQLWAAMWQRDRKAWHFTESGSGSGIYMSNDGGNTWQLITTAGSGFPSGPGCGRIGLSISRKNNQDIIYAVIDNQAKRPTDKTEVKKAELVKSDFRQMTKEQFLAIPPKKLKAFLVKNNFPEKYSAEKVIKMIKSDKIQPSALADYLEDANAALFSSDQPIEGAEVYSSAENGKTWQKMNKENLDGLFYSYGYYFAQIRTAYDNPDKVFLLGVPLLMSNDGCKTWQAIDGDNVHADHHALWINPANNGHLINGNDGGINITYDYGKTWAKCNSPAVGQFYSVNYDMAEPFNIYGGMQDNGVWKGSSENELSDRWHSTGEYGFKSYIGGDGMQVAIDNRDNQTVYTGYQFGNYFRINQKTGDYEFISPSHELGERPLRFNWQSPVALSTFNQDILYFGANKLYRSMNRGKTWTAISDDLTNGGKPGNVPFGTLTSFHESPLQFGQIVTGSDDGKINITRDGGSTWIDISKGLPAALWVSRVQFSAFSLSRIYISLNGYRNDYFESHVYMSDDYGNNWTRIGTTLPAEPINVIKEDPQNEDILYVGTDHGLYVSLDRGKSFMGMNHSLPGVSIHDLFVHPRDHKLVIGTHGRSIYITDVANVQQLNNENLAKELMVFPITTIQAGAWGKKFSAWDTPKSPEIEISFYSKEEGPSNISITDEDKNVLFSTSINAIKGLNKFVYNGTVDEKINPKYTNTLLKAARKENPEADTKLIKADDGKYYIQSGKYKATVKRNHHIAETEMEIE